MNAAIGAIVVILLIIAIGYYAAKKHGNDDPPGPAGPPTPTPTACNQWKAYVPSETPPSWASQMPGCPPGKCMTPAVADVGTGGPCMGAAGIESGTTPLDTGNLYGTHCQAGSKTGGYIPYSSDSGGLYHIERDPACGPWKTTTDSSNAFAYKGVPVCYPTASQAGVITSYDPVSQACQSGTPTAVFGAGWKLLANDMVPGTGS